mgnify:CR=1 FL=1
MSVDFPHPEGPTKATFYPYYIDKLRFSNTFLSLSAYLKVRLLNSIFPIIGFLNLDLYSLSSL